MARSAGARGRGSLLAAVILLLIGTVQATHWRYGNIKWTTCDGGFYDPAFPEVCRKCTSPLCVGVTIDTAIAADSVTGGEWVIPFSFSDPAAEGTTSVWLRYVQEDVNAYLADPTARLLRLNRNIASPFGPNKHELRIGYMKGLNDDARPPSVANPFEGVIECPVRPCAQSLDYNFYIDRLDMLTHVVYAHYSFEIQFDENGDYSVYVDGCCRPSIFKNSFDLPFHLRAGIQIYADGQVGGAARPYPKQSIRVSMPNVVTLRAQGIAYDGCKEFPCEKVGDETVCFLRFMVQTLHPIEDYRSKIAVRMANAGETGWWRCGGGLGGGEASSPEWMALCADQTNALSFVAPALTTLEMRSDGDGYYFIKFMVSRTGSLSSQVVGQHSLSLMVDCVGCVNGVTQSVPIEISVDVKVAPANADPPAFTFNPRPLTDVSGIQDAVPVTCPQSAVQVYCGRKRFELGEGGSKYSKDFLRVSFKDVDDGTGIFCDAENPDNIAKKKPQQIKVIQAASTLPAGIAIGDLVFGPSLPSSYLNPNGAGYVDLTWRPRCENPSDLGLKQLCFTARDSYLVENEEDASFNFLWSPPSLLDTSGFTESSNADCPIPAGLRSSCIYINSQAPKTNIPPAFVAPTTLKGRECSAGCCDCCGQENCYCESTSRCCTILYTTIGRVFTHVVRAVDGPIYAHEADGGSGIYPERDDHDSYAVFVNFSFPSDIKPSPAVSPMKYGCGDKSYATCVSDPTKKDDSLTELVWDLTGLGFSCYKVGANTTSKCTGTEDKATCLDGGGTECTKDNVPLPFRVCYQAQEQMAPWVDEALWKRTYGESPILESCHVCFKLAIADRPVFLDDDNVSPVQGALFEIPAGREFKLSITAAAANDAGVVVMSILSDPGAPVGASLGPPRKVLCNEVEPVCKLFHESGYQRHFSYTPLVEHGGQRFEICFRASMEELKPGADLDSQLSMPRCITISVLQAQVVWDGTTPCDTTNGAGTCAPEAHITTTVGCNVAYNLQAKAQLYDLSIKHQKLPTCSNCVGGGLVVHACSETGNKWPCCGNGHCDGAEMGSNCPADCPADDSSLRIVQSGSVNNDYVARAEFRWTATRGMEGRRLLACFAATDSLLATTIVHVPRTTRSAPSFCVVVDVDRCAYCVPDGSSMMYVAKHYVLNVDWLRLYNTNPGATDPDGVFPYEKLVIGPTYSVHPGDTLLSIAGSAKTTLKAILENNPDILDDSDLREGQKICLLLCSAAPAP